jgi:hypothetical protein
MKLYLFAKIVERKENMQDILNRFGKLASCLKTPVDFRGMMVDVGLLGECCGS